jgi:hypothetical protein
MADLFRSDLSRSPTFPPCSLCLREQPIALAIDAKALTEARSHGEEEIGIGCCRLEFMADLFRSDLSLSPTFPPCSLCLREQPLAWPIEAKALTEARSHGEEEIGNRVLQARVQGRSVPIGFVSLPDFSSVLSVPP